MKILGKLTCWAQGHKRGKLISSVPYQDAPSFLYNRYQCPRCLNVTPRKVKVKS